MNGQRDVDVPRCLRHRLGSLLACFEKHLEGRVVEQWREDKEPGGHVTSWWIYAQLSPVTVSSSVVVFGETEFAEVNAVPHLWIRGKDKWIGDGFKLLHDFISAERRAAELPPPPPTSGACSSSEPYVLTEKSTDITESFTKRELVTVRWYGSLHVGIITNIDYVKNTFRIHWREEVSQSTIPFVDFISASE